MALTLLSYSIVVVVKTWKMMYGSEHVSLVVIAQKNVCKEAISISLEIDPPTFMTGGDITNGG